eukprot:CAMPEP_0197593494 /NCGR_PEP_ID=MMETSP1326-20131121/18319_1 /TAXON_ID=1155430 /ORGANISM="Genus nov. species nov., Strain RCC2288" /LENGTH=55 /DNA_ID=CAMNT_0043159479 /DNA_START=53 /DNA_END=217 /DNA_ORIENTATION=-
MRKCAHRAHLSATSMGTSHAGSVRGRLNNTAPRPPPPPPPPPAAPPPPPPAAPPP